MLNEFKNILRRNCLVDEGDGVLIAVSGGIDSMVLFHLFNSIKEKWSLDLLAVHVNYQKRGKDSEQDQELVEKICDDYGVPYISEMFDEEFDKENFQNLAREFRYGIFQKVAEENSLNKIATAHNLNDQAETVIAHMIRGAGLNGLHGIAENIQIENDMAVVRPLLKFSRDEIEKYAKENTVLFREDKSNLETKYQRNQIRHLILPELKKLNPNILEHINNLSSDAKEILSFTQFHVDRFCEAQMVKKKNELFVNRERFLEQMGPVKSGILRGMYCAISGSVVDLGRDHIDRMNQISEKGDGSYKLPHSIEFFCDSDTLRMATSS
ncbi:tRNA lysidine(34) synthetase TilS [bacterium]|nr:tRNA lysidine(34) synthetase TilS [bacterium]